VNSRILWCLPILLILVTACGETRHQPTAPEAAALSASPRSMQMVPPRQETTWSKMSPEELWDHVAAFDTSVVIGLKAPGASRGIWRGQVLLDVSERSAARSAVHAVAGLTPTAEMDTLPVLDVRVASPQAIAVLRELPVVDYVEPGVMDIRHSSTKGCEYPAWTGTADTTAWGDLLPPHFTRADVQIDRAWNRSQGGDVVVGVMDTGVSYYQNHLHGWFDTGQSSGRWYTLESVLPGDGSHAAWHDQCGHGTRVTGAAVGPMNGDNMVGAAWKSDLVGVRMTDDVIMPKTTATAEAISVAASYVPPGQTPHNRRVVIMAWGHKDSYSTVADQIEWRYHQNGALFVAASGTSGWFTSWIGVVFPARMNEVIAVSAVKSNYSRSSSIHYGSEVELTFLLDELTMGFVSPDLAEVSGSSGATAVVGGIAALVWAQYPSAGRDWIRNRLRWSGHNY
jgi:serine protease